MIKYSDNPISYREKITEAFDTSVYRLKFSTDRVEIEEIENSQKSYILINETDAQSELDTIKTYGDYFIAGDGYLVFVLLDSNSQINDKEIEIEGAFKGTIKKYLSSLGLLISNFKNIVNMDILDGEEHYFGDIVKKDMVICELNFDSNQQITSIQERDILINSVLAHLSYSYNIFIEFPTISSLLHKEKIKAGTKLTVKKLTDNEPILYFLLAEKIEYPHLKYLEYYHVIEYYFLHKRIEDIKKIIKNVIAAELAQSNNIDNSDYYSKITELMRFYNGKDEKELDQLIYVITYDLGFEVIKDICSTCFNIGPRFLKDSIFNIDATAVDTINQTYNKAKDIWDLNKLKDVTKGLFCEQLARRIYNIRNLIVTASA